MARPAPLRDHHDHFRFPEEEDAPDDLSPEHVEGDGDQQTQEAGLHDRPSDTEWGAVINTPDPQAAVNDDAAELSSARAEIAAAQPEPFIETKPSPPKQDGGMSVIALALMALVAASLSAAVVLFVF
jgi:hypothetical protein